MKTYARTHTNCFYEEQKRISRKSGVGGCDVRALSSGAEKKTNEL